MGKEGEGEGRGGRRTREKRGMEEETGERGRERERGCALTKHDLPSTGLVDSVRNSWCFHSRTT